MNDSMQNGMAEAMRLTQSGQLAEATAAIQRALGGSTGGSFAPPMTWDVPTWDVPADGAAGGTGDPFAALSGLLNAAPMTTAPPAPGPAEEHTLRRPPRPPRHHRGGTPRTGDTPGAIVDLPVDDNAPAGGRFLERSYTNAAGTRPYKLYVPGGYAGQEVPLVVMLHGCTQNPDDFAAGTHMNALAEEHTFLVAYPAQAGGANMQGCWNWFQAADQQRGRGEPSIIAGITCEVVGEYNVATDGVYIAGMSAGGAMAAIVGEAYPDVYSAIGVHSGLAPGAARDMPSAFSAMRGGGAVAPRSGAAVPTIVFHGDRDTTVNPRNAEQLVSRHPGGGANGSAAPIKVREGRVPGGHSYTRAVHRDADGRAVVERWTVHGLGHAWSGGSSPGSYTDPNGPDASAEMLRFFLRQREQG